MDFDTRDLDSYIPGYDEYQEKNSKVALEDYRELENKVGHCKKAINEIEDVIYNPKEYEESEMIKLTKAILEDLKKKIGG